MPATPRLPALRRRDGHHARVTYEELFFDLVYVFAVTQLSHHLLHHLGLLGVLWIKAGIEEWQGAFEQAGLEWLLELGNSSITYRSRYLAVAQLIPVLDLLLLDEQNPHAVLFQLKLVSRSLKRLNDDFAAPRELALPILVERLAGFDLGCLENALFGDSSVRSALNGLADLLQEIADVSNQVSDRLALRHFAHVDDISQRTVSV